MIAEKFPYKFDRGQFFFVHTKIINSIKYFTYHSPLESSKFPLVGGWALKEVVVNVYQKN
jgi:hypothetical protein